jgi:hypothetical protein
MHKKGDLWIEVISGMTFAERVRFLAKFARLYAKKHGGKTVTQRARANKRK